MSNGLEENILGSKMQGIWISMLPGTKISHLFMSWYFYSFSLEAENFN